MDHEEFISGYCRCLDQARTVTAETEDGVFSADCSFGACPHEGSCTIAEKLTQLRAQWTEGS